jgi:hypothetical protein
MIFDSFDYYCVGYKIINELSHGPRLHPPSHPKKEYSFAKIAIFQMQEQDYSSPGPIYNTSGLGQKQKSASHRIGNSTRTQINHWMENTPSPAHYSPHKHKQ